MLFRSNGIAIKLEVASNSEDRFLNGYAKLSGKEFDITWDSFSGSTVTQSGSKTGYIYIDKSQFTTNLKNAKLQISIGEYLEESLYTKVNEGTKTLFVSLDISPPVISPVYNKGSGTVSINTFDSVSGTKDLIYSIDGGAWQNYAGTFSVPASSQYVDVVAVDFVENSSTHRLYFTKDAEQTDVPCNVYTYKTKNSVICIVGGRQSNAKGIALSDFKVE